MVSLEIGEDENGLQCRCCGAAGSTGHGFFYRDGDAYGVYYAAWSRAHPERGVSLALAVGEWDEGATTAQRTCVGVEAYEGQSEILFRFIGPSESPWPSTDLLGPMLERQAALSHPLKEEFLALSEVVVRGHPAVAQFLKIQEAAP